MIQNEITKAKSLRTTGIDRDSSFMFLETIGQQSMSMTNVRQWSVFNNIQCVLTKFWSMNQELVLESKRLEASAQWHLEVLSLTCVTKTLLTQFDELEPSLCIGSTNLGLSNQMAPSLGYIYLSNASSSWLSTWSQFDGVGLLGLLNVIGKSRLDLVLALG